MPAQDVTVSATFEEEKPPVPESITLSLTTPTDVVKNIPETAADITVPLTVAMTWGDGGDQTDKAEITWEVTGVEGVTGENVATEDNKAATLTIPQTVVTPGKITVKAKCDTVESDPITIRLDDKLVKTDDTTKKTTIYVSSDKQEEAENQQTMKNGKAPVVNDEVATEIMLNNNKGYRATANITFDTSSIADKTIYSAILYVPAGYGYQGKNAGKTEPLTVNGHVSSNSLKYGEGENSVGEYFKIDISDDSETLKSGTYNPTFDGGTAHTRSILSREAMKSDIYSEIPDNHRGAYIEIQEGIELKVTYTGSKSVEGLTVKVTGDGDFSKEVTTDESGVATVIVPYSADMKTYTFATDATKDYEASSTSVTTTAKEGTCQLNDRTAELESLEIVTSKLNSGTGSDNVILKSESEREIGTISVKGTDTEGLPMEVESVEWEVKDSGTADASTKVVIDSGTGVVKINETATAGEYTITAKSGEVTSTPYTLKIADNGSEQIMAASEDFEGETNIFGAGAATEGDDGHGHKQPTSGGVYSPESGGWNGEHALIASSGEKSFTLSKPITADSNEKIEISYTEFNGWRSPGTNTVTLYAADGETKLVEYVYDSDARTIKSMQIGGVDAGSFEAFDAQSKCTEKSNGCNGFDYWASNGTKGQYFMKGQDGNNVITITIDGSLESDNLTIKYETKGQTTATKTYTGTVSQKSFGKMTITGNIGSHTQSSGMDDLVTKVIRDAE